MAARLANALVTLRAQVNAAHPGRALFNDGWIGDAAHQARKSDHNPNAAGVVQAVDLSHDPAHGFDSYAFADMLRQKRDNRLKYVISNGRIFSSSVNAWEWRSYTGADDHSHHVHVSASDDPARYDDDRKWDIDAAGVAPPIDPPPVMKSTVDDATRQTMARHILDFEARRDKNGHLAVYNLPPNDGGGRWEIAGINEKYDGPELLKLKAMLDAGQFDAAEVEAERYYLENTAPAASWTTDAGVEFYLRDCVFNRGAHGAARILQRACSVPDDGQIGPISRAAIARIAPGDMLIKLRAAREDYERNVVGYRANFWQGLVNRWNAALVIAMSYQTAKKGTPMPTDTATAPTAPQDIFAKIKEVVDQFKAQQAGAPAAGAPIAVHAPDLTPLLKILETAVGTLPFIAGIVPQLTPVTPFIPLIQGVLKLLEELQSAPHNPQAVAAIIAKHMQDVATNVQVFTNQMHPPAIPTQAPAPGA